MVVLMLSLVKRGTKHEFSMNSSLLLFSFNISCPLVSINLILLLHCDTNIGRAVMLQ